MVLGCWFYKAVATANDVLPSQLESMLSMYRAATLQVNRVYTCFNSKQFPNYRYTDIETLLFLVEFCCLLFFDRIHSVILQPGELYCLQVSQNRGYSPTTPNQLPTSPFNDDDHFLCFEKLTGLSFSCPMSSCMEDRAI
jgi:hypothetical protein